MSEYPSDWNLVPIREIISESRIDPELDDPSKRISVRLHCEGVEKRSERATDQAGATRYYKRLAGQFIYGKQNLHKGAVGIVPNELHGFCSSQDIPAFDITQSVDPNWFLHLFRQRSFYESLESIATGTGSKRIQPSELGEKEIAVPPLPEQKKIAEILSGIDKAMQVIYQRKKKIDLIFRQVVVQATTPYHRTGWREYTIEEVVDFQGGAQPPRATFKFSPEDGYIRMLQIRDFKSDARATYIPLNQCKRFCGKDDVMIGRYGPPNFQILRGKEGSYNVALIKALPRENGELSKDYLFRFLQRRDLFLLMDALSQRTSGQQGLDMDALKEFPFFLPDMITQSDICKSLDAIESISQGLMRKVQSLDHLKSALSGQLLSGRKRVSV